MTPPRFIDVVEAYLTVRRGLGFDLESPGWQLRDFARYADGIGHRGHVTTDLAVQWASASRSRDPAQAVRRLSVVRSFARYRAAFDAATDIPPPGLLGRLPGRKPPHIYSAAEIAALLHAAHRLYPRHGLRPDTYVALFSLLIATGLPLSEACHLLPRDVDVANGIQTVREGKCRKSRLIPLHPTAILALSVTPPVARRVARGRRKDLQSAASPAWLDGSGTGPPAARA
jgi:integrase